VNGDWWAIGPVEIVSISPAWDGQKNGTMVNPGPVPSADEEIRHGYDARDTDYYDSELTDNKTENMPLRVSQGQSIVSTISLDIPYQDGRSYLKTAAVLTVLGEVPPTDAFRPPYAAGEKPIFRLSNVRRELLPDLEPVGSVLDTETYADKFQRVWLDHMESIWAQHIHPLDNMGVYSREIGFDVQEAGLLLMVDNEDDERLLINFLQVGIDLYYISRQNNTLWTGTAGQANGRKWPIVFAGIMFDNEKMKSPNARFGEDDQTYYYNDSELPETDPWGFPQKNIKGWSGAGALWGIKHESDMLDSSFFQDHEHVAPSQWIQIRDSYTTGEPCGENNDGCKAEEYRRCCTSHTWIGQALAARIMNAKEIWGHPAFFDYADRWMTEQLSQEQLDMLSASGQQWSQLPASSQSKFVDEMWNRYRYINCTNGIQDEDETGIDCGGSCERDFDRDGYEGGLCNAPQDILDCDDYNPNVNPGFGEICGNQKDDDCDRIIDEAGCIEPPNDFVSYWKFNDGANANIFADEKGINNGSCSGNACPAYSATGGVNESGAYEFDGINDFIDLGTSDFGIYETNEITLAFWTKVISNNPDADYDPLIQRFNFRPFGVQIDMHDTVRTGLLGISDAYKYSESKLEPGEWHHIALTYKNGERKLYIDGTLEALDNPTGDFYSDTRNTTLGAYISSTPSNSLFSNIAIDNLAIFKRALSSEEILGVYLMN